MKALISPTELLVFEDGTSGQRVCETHPTGFPVADPLYWVDCEETLDPVWVYWNGGSFVDIPPPPPPPEVEMLELEVTDLGVNENNVEVGNE